MQPKRLHVKILSNRKTVPGPLGPGSVFLLRLKAPAIAKVAVPGQFIHARCAERLDPLLRRPFSIHSVKGDTIEIFYKVVGRGTKLLSEKKPGDTLDIIGSLGNGFEGNEKNGARPRFLEKRGLAPFLIAGGMGVAPLYFLAERLAKDKKGEKVVVLGAKNKKELFCVSKLRKLGFKVLVATDDGSAGQKGLATDVLKEVLRSTKYEVRDTKIYACGPKAMLKEVSRIAARRRIECQVSLENWMGCGVGACFACAVKIRHGKKRNKQSIKFIYKRVCKDGPVFDGTEVVWG